MKKTLHIFSITVLIAGIVFVMSACNSSPKKDANGLVLAAIDTTGLAAFQNWKAVQNQSQYMPVAQPVAVAQPKPVVRRPAATAPKPVAQETKKKGWSGVRQQKVQPLVRVQVR